MAEVRLKDSFPFHPKALKAGPVACWLYVCSIGYCQRLHTDGFVAVEVVHTLGVDVVKHAYAIEALVEARLWDVEKGGWRVHDYLHHNKSARQIRQLVKKKRLAGRAGGLAKASRVSSNVLSILPSEPVADCLAARVTRRDRDRDRHRNPGELASSVQPATSTEKAAALPRPQRVPTKDPDPRGRVSVITAVVTKDILPRRLLDEANEAATKARCLELGIPHDDVAIRKAVDSALFRYYRVQRLEQDLPPDPRGIYHDHQRPRRATR
jgi:hypothetical protein